MPGTVVVVLAVVAANPPGPDQLKLTPVEGEAPVKVTEVVVQVSGPDTLAVAPGVEISCITVTVVVEIQPFTGLVTVNVYVPGVAVGVLASVEFNPPGPVHRKLTPAVGDEPINVTPRGVKQVKIPDADAVAPGAATFWITFTDAVEVHPLTGLVTVSV